MFIGMYLPDSRNSMGVKCENDDGKTTIYLFIDADISLLRSSQYFVRHFAINISLLAEWAKLWKIKSKHFRYSRADKRSLLFRVSF